MTRAGPAPYRTTNSTWNQSLYIRVRPSGGIASCGAGAYTLSYSRPSECTNGTSRAIVTGSCDNGCGLGDLTTTQYCYGNVWSTSPVGSASCVAPFPCFFDCSFGTAVCPGNCGDQWCSGFPDSCC